MTTSNSTSKRVTKAVRYNQLRAIAESAGKVELVEFIDHELELLAKKNTSSNGEKTLTATQKENIGLKSAILGNMEAEKLYTISDMIKNFPELEGLSTSKVSAIVRRMRNDVEGGSGEIIRIEDKRKTYFKLA